MVTLSIYSPGCAREAGLFHRYVDRKRRDAIGHNYQRTRSRFHAGRHIDMSVSWRIAGLHAHVAVVVGLGIEDVPSGDIRDPHQWLISRGFKFIPERSSLRPTNK